MFPVLFNKYRGKSFVMDKDNHWGTDSDSHNTLITDSQTLQTKDRERDGEFKFGLTLDQINPRGSGFIFTLSKILMYFVVL